MAIRPKSCRVARTMFVYSSMPRPTTRRDRVPLSPRNTIHSTSSTADTIE